MDKFKIGDELEKDSFVIRKKKLAELPPDTCLLELIGEIDLYTVDLIRQFTNNIIQEGFKKICIQMSEVYYIDSSGLGFFLKLHMQVKSSPGYVRIVAPSKEVSNVLELTKLSKILLKFPNLSAALRRPIF
ncbi:MAG: STAS domain-containing protein [Spirochaetota bacterium]